MGQGGWRFVEPVGVPWRGTLPQRPGALVSSAAGKGRQGRDSATALLGLKISQEHPCNIQITPSRVSPGSGCGRSCSTRSASSLSADEPSPVGESTRLSGPSRCDSSPPHRATASATGAPGWGEHGALLRRRKRKPRTGAVPWYASRSGSPWSPRDYGPSKSCRLAWVRRWFQGPLSSPTQMHRSGQACGRRRGAVSVMQGSGVGIGVQPKMGPTTARLVPGIARASGGGPVDRPEPQC